MPLLLTLLALLGTNPTAPPPPPPPGAAAPAPVFSDADRAAIVAFWSAPGRAEVHLAPVRVASTPEGSQWFAAYNRAARAAAPADQSLWKAWVDVKLARDRRDADRAVGLSSNGDSPSPGVIPPSLLVACGDPPPFAAPVLPKQWTIDLGDGPPLTYTDHVPLGPRYAYYRSPEGVVAGGTPLSRLPDSERDALFAAAGLTPFERHVMQAVSPLEGGFDAVNTYDTGYVSVGFIQFITAADGTGSLAAVLAREKAERPSDFAQDFHQRGIDVDSAGVYTVVDPATGAELTGRDAVRRTVGDPRLVAVFQDAGRRSVAFRAAQIAVAKHVYYPADDALAVTLPGGATLSGKVSDAIHSEAGMATLFDRKVNTGTLTPALPNAIAQVMTAHGVTTWAGLAPYEREVIAAVKYRADFLGDARLTQPPARERSPALEVPG